MVLSQVPEFGGYDYICDSLRWLAYSLLISGSLEILCQRWWGGQFTQILIKRIVPQVWNRKEQDFARIVCKFLNIPCPFLGAQHLCMVLSHPWSPHRNVQSLHPVGHGVQLFFQLGFPQPGCVWRAARGDAVLGRLLISACCGSCLVMERCGTWLCIQLWCSPALCSPSSIAVDWESDWLAQQSFSARWSLGSLQSRS